jgi:wobble nucleotide-excising tRNase
MITKVKFLKNIGKFYDCTAKGNELDWYKNTFLFSPNAYGKSTLVDVLRSLRDNEPKFIRARRTLNAVGVPEAVIIVDGVNHIFNGTKWDKPYPAIQLFDVPFIHANILTHEIEHGHRKNIHKIIIGAQGIKLAQELASLKTREKERRQEFDSLMRQFNVAGFRHHALAAFLAIPDTDEAAVAGRIQKLKQDIKSKGSETKVRSLGNPNVLSPPTFDLTELKTIATQKVSSVHDAARERVENHIVRNIKDRDHAKEFIRQGLDLVQADCPFCGQDLKNASDLLTAYRQFFDDAFRTYQQKLAQQSGTFAKWNLDNELTSLVSTYNANTAITAQWEPFIGALALPDVTPIVETCRVEMGDWKQKAQAEIKNKEREPNYDFDLSALDVLSDELAALGAAIENYNSAVISFTAKTKDYITKLPESEVASIQTALEKELEIEKRFKPEWKKWATDYKAAKEDAEGLLDKKNTKQEELEKYSKSIFNTYQKRINELLLTLGADFSITDLTVKTDERASEAYSDFAFLILEKRVPITTRQEDGACFKNTLSEGDKSTLAFAFFIAALEKLAELDKQIVILDDPLSSLDENRRHATALVLLNISPKLKQLCVLTHKKDFLGMLFDKMVDNKVLQIRSDRKNGSRFDVFDVEEDRKSDYARMIEGMERYIAEDFGPTTDTMQGDIRKVFEVILKTKYYRRLASEIRAKKGLSKLLEILFNDGILEEALKPQLFDLCSVTSGPHHGEIVNVPSKKLTRDELIPLIRNALDMLEKV